MIKHNISNKPLLFFFFFCKHRIMRGIIGSEIPRGQWLPLLRLFMQTHQWLVVTHADPGQTAGTGQRWRWRFGHFALFLRFPYFRPAAVRVSAAANSNTTHCPGAGHAVQGENPLTCIQTPDKSKRSRKHRESSKNRFKLFQQNSFSLTAAWEDWMSHFWKAQN